MSVKKSMVSFALGTLMLSSSLMALTIEDFSGKKPVDWNDSMRSPQIIQKLDHLSVDKEQLTMTFYYQFEKYRKGDRRIEFIYPLTSEEQVSKLDALAVMGFKRELENGMGKGMVLKFKDEAELVLAKEMIEKLSDKFTFLVPDTLLQSTMFGEGDRPMEWNKFKRATYLRFGQSLITRLGHYLGGWQSSLAAKERGE